MVAPQRFHPPERRVPGMDGVMHGSVEQVAQNESRKKGKRIAPHQPVHDGENNGGDEDAGHRWHKQAVAVARVVMVVAVHDVNKLLRPRAFGHPVKRKTVHEVFEKRPEKNAAQSYQQNGACSKLQRRCGVQRHTDNEGKVHAPDNKGMAFGEQFEIWVAKQLRLPFVVNFIILHAVEFCTAKVRERAE